MHIFIFIITAMLLYPILGTVFCIFFTFLKSDNQKLKIIVLTFFHPLIYTAILWLIFPSIFNYSLLWLVFYLLAVLIRDIVFNNTKYLLNLTITNESISIDYINSFLKRKSLDISIANIKEIELSSMKTIWDYPALLRYDHDFYNNYKFLILDKKIWEQAGKMLNAGNLNVAVSF